MDGRGYPAPNIQHLTPEMRSELCRIFGLSIKSYGFMMVVGFALGIWRAVRVAKKRYGIEPARVYDIALVVLLAGVFGARLVFVVIEGVPWREFIEVWYGGLSFHGGLAFALLFGYVYTRYAKLSYWNCADMVAPSIAIAYACTRIGCFLNGCCYGCPTDLPWGVRFAGEPYPCHPTQIYATLANVAIFFILVRLEKMNRVAGFVFAGYVGLYGVYRFLIEFLREGSTAEVWYSGLTHAQWVSILMILVSVVAVAILRRTARNA